MPAIHLKQFRKRLLLGTVGPGEPAGNGGQIDGASQAKRTRLPITDLLIGVTALEPGYDDATANVRHFASIPGLKAVNL